MIYKLKNIINALGLSLVEDTVTETVRTAIPYLQEVIDEMESTVSSSWCAGDIKNMRPEWSDAECAEALSKCSNTLGQRLCEEGQDILVEMLIILYDKTIISRVVEGISLNGDEHLLNEDGSLMMFDSEYSAKEFLMDSGVTDLESLTFENHCISPCNTREV